VFSQANPPNNGFCLHRLINVGSPIAFMPVLTYFSGMDNIPENNLFEISLSQQGASWLLRLYKVTRWLFVLGIVLSVLFFINIGLRFRINMRYTTPDNWLSVLQLNLYGLFDTVVVIITFIQIYYYFKFTRTCKMGIEELQPDLFNDSFKWLFKNTVMASVMFVLQLILACFAIFGDLVLLKTQQH
jgi:hypothetical protein